MISSSLKKAHDRAARDLLARAIEEHHGDLARIAGALQCSVRSVQRWVARHGLQAALAHAREGAGAAGSPEPPAQG